MPGESPADDNDPDPIQKMIDYVNANPAQAGLLAGAVVVGGVAVAMTGGIAGVLFAF